MALNPLLRGVPICSGRIWIKSGPHGPASILNGGLLDPRPPTIALKGRIRA